MSPLLKRGVSPLTPQCHIIDSLRFFKLLQTPLNAGQSNIFIRALFELVIAFQPVCINCSLLKTLKNPVSRDWVMKMKKK